MDPTRRWKAVALLLALASIDCVFGDVFMNSPKSVYVPEGSTTDVVLECRASDHVTNPTYSWTKDGSPVDTSDPDKCEILSGNLYIHTPTSSDLGEYRCKIDSPEGIAISDSARLDFQTISAPTKTKSSLEWPESKGLELECGQITHSPEYSVIYMWQTEDFSVIKPTGEFGKYVSQKTGNLYLANPKTDDSETYNCMARTTWELNGQKTSYTINTVHLTINDAVGEYDAVFMATPQEVTYVALGGKTYLECFASGNPTPKITWTRDGSAENLPDSAKVSPSGQLAFIDVEEDAEGVYTCTANNSHNSISAQAQLVLKYPPRWTDVGLSSDAYDLDSDVELVCSAHAVPAATYTWYTNGTELDRNAYTIMDQPGYSKLALSKLQVEDAGIYECRAKNELGDIVSAAVVEVNSYAPNISPEVEALTYAGFEQPITIDCPHTAAPAAEISWMKDGSPISTNDSRIEIFKNASLHIRVTMLEDQGQYTCVLKNKLGSDTSSGNLKVYDPTTITTAPQDVQAVAGERVLLKCEASWDSQLGMSWVWKHDDEVLDDLLSTHYIKNGGQLQIDDVSGEDNGIYTCCAETKVGSACASATVYVVAPPDPPTGIVVKSATDNSQQLSWTAGSDNHSPITSYIIECKNSYQKNWRRPVTVPAIVNKTHCEVTGLNPYNDYVYRITAVNGQGEGEASDVSAVYPTNKGLPSRAPVLLPGGGGKSGELLIVWKPLPVQYRGSDVLDYVLSIRKSAIANPNVPDIIAPVVDLTSNATEVVIEPDWTKVTVKGGDQQNYTYAVDESEVYVPYDVKIQAKNDIGEGPESNIRIVRTYEETPDKAPQNVKKQKARAYDAVLTWDRVVATTGHVDGYEVNITYGAGSSKGKDQSKRTTKGLTKIKFDGLLSNHVYLVTVAAYNSAGLGPLSNTFKFSTTKKPPSKGPDGFHATITNALVSARWDAIKSDNINNQDEEPLTGYKLEYWIDGVMTSKEAFVQKTNNTNIDFGVTDGVSYNIRVRGYNAGGDGPPSPIQYLPYRKTGKYECCGANSLKFNSAIVIAVTLLWLLFMKLDL